MKLTIDLDSLNLLPLDTTNESLTTHTKLIVNSLLTNSITRTLSMPFTPDNQQRIAEELGYRRALLEFLSYFTPQEN